MQRPRRFVADRASLSPEQELAFTEAKINDNFSNYSAWHNRSKLLPAAYPRLDLDSSILETEFELMRQAFFTEPEDQSGWMYFLWLLGQVCPSQPPALAATWPPEGTPQPSQPLEEHSRSDPTVLLAFTEPVAGVGPETVGARLRRSGGSTGTTSSEGPESVQAGVDTVTSPHSTVTLSWEPVGPSGSCAQLWRGRCTSGIPAASTGASLGPLGLELSVGVRRGIVSALGSELKQEVTVSLSIASGVPQGSPGASLAGSELQPPPATDAASPADVAPAADVAPPDSLALGLGGEGAESGAGESRDWKEWGRAAVEKEIESIRELQELEPNW